MTYRKETCYYLNLKNYSLSMNPNTLTLIHSWSIASVKALQIYKHALEEWFQVTHIIPTLWAIPFYIDAILREKNSKNYSQLIADYLCETSLEPSDIQKLLMKNSEDIFRWISKVLTFGETSLASSFGKWVRDIKHITVARANNILVAPASANMLGKITSGITDNFALEVIRAFDPSHWWKVFIAPAMNTQMLHDPAIQDVLQKLQNPLFKEKYELLPTQSKLLACWENWDGAMIPTKDIFEEISKIQ